MVSNLQVRLQFISAIYQRQEKQTSVNCKKKFISCYTSDLWHFQDNVNKGFTLGRHLECIQQLGTVKTMFLLMAYFCFLLLCVLGGSSDGGLNMPLNMGTYFLKMTAVTVKFLSSFSVLCRNSFGRLAISCHFFILLKNSIKLGGEQRTII